MQYRCYSCGLKLGDGIPPLEALSTEQVSVVGEVQDAPQRFSVLEGTKFEGMSTYSFCSFCLYMMQIAPDAYYHRSEQRDGIEAFPWSGSPSQRWVYYGRLMTLLAAKVIYEHVDFTEAESLMTADLEIR